VQRSPARVAFAVIRSAPARLAVSARSSNDPLGAPVTARGTTNDDAVPPQHDVPADTDTVLVDLELDIPAWRRLY
jgi:hypothetical protein